MLQKLYPYRFEFFFFSQIAILFGSLIVPSNLFENIVSPILFQINLFAGIVLLSKKKKLMWFLIMLLVITIMVFALNNGVDKKSTEFDFLKLLSIFIFYIIVTIGLISQVWKAVVVNKNVIFGLVSGYISLGFIGFFICFSIELAQPNSFQGFLTGISTTDNLMYYSYITLLTIGYGDILPTTALAQKGVMLIGLVGQIYLVVITAIVIGKYLNQTSK